MSQRVTGFVVLAVFAFLFSSTAMADSCNDTGEIYGGWQTSGWTHPYETLDVCNYSRWNCDRSGGQLWQRDFKGQDFWGPDFRNPGFLGLGDRKLLEWHHGGWEGAGEGSRGTPVTVPEPSSPALTGMGLLGLAGAIRRKLRR